jgi:hypothetical protein
MSDPFNLPAAPGLPYGEDFLARDEEATYIHAIDACGRRHFDFTRMRRISIGEPFYHACQYWHLHRAIMPASLAIGRLLTKQRG